MSDGLSKARKAVRQASAASEAFEACTIKLSTPNRELRHGEIRKMERLEDEANRTAVNARRLLDALKR